jgi:hypothetical protein
VLSKQPHPWAALKIEERWPNRDDSATVLIALKRMRKVESYGATSLLLADVKTLPIDRPSVVMMTTDTIEISTMINAYSTSPCPLPVFTARRVTRLEG